MPCRANGALPRGVSARPMDMSAERGYQACLLPYPTGWAPEDGLMEPCQGALVVLSTHKGHLDCKAQPCL